MRAFFSFLNAVALSSAGVVPAIAAEGDEVSSGNYVYRACESSKVEERLACTAYLRGVMDGAVAGSVSASISMAKACPPDGLGYQQGMDILKKYLRENPESRHNNVGVIYVVALHEAFPCKE